MPSVLRTSAPLLLAALLGGCIADGDTGGEIRIDAFSHHWRTLQANGDSVSGDTVFTAHGRTVLLETDLDETVSLPAHVTGESQGYTYLHYPLKGEGKNYTCFVRIDEELGQMTLEEAAQAGLDEEDAVYRSTETLGTESFEAWFFRHADVDQPVRDGTCEWVPGKGLYVDAGAAFLGEYIIRY